MKWHRALTTLTAAGSALSFVGCSSPSSAPGSPPTFVLAWIAPGGQVRSLESMPGSAWARSGIDPQATTLTPDLGPAIAHDGLLTWMLMWVNGPELQYKVGVGGKTPTAGITWEQSANVNRLIANTDTSPALAYGNGRWVVVFRRAGGQLHVSRTSTSSAAQWTAPTVVMHADVTPLPATSQRAPALVFGRFGGQDVFVLVYAHPNLGAVATTSPDGLTWSPPVAIAATEKDPALCASNGILYALLSRSVGTLGLHGFIFKSTDGANWSEIATYPRAARSVTGAAMAYGDCNLIITEQLGRPQGGTPDGINERSGTPTGRCDNPAGFNVGNDRPISLDLVNVETVGNPSARTALAFGVAASRTPRRLLITEWFPEVVELHLDEIAGRTLDLTGISLEVHARVDLQPNVDEPDYHARAELVGTMTGGEFRVLFEEFGYAGPPVIGTFTDPLTRRQFPGIKLKQGFFGWNLGGTSTSLRISGRSPDGTVDDVLLLGNRPRPAAGGSFIEDTANPVTLPLAPPGTSRNTLRRRWDPEGPRDTDRESDWTTGRSSFGAGP